jgi:hypothetical protein
MKVEFHCDGIGCDSRHEVEVAAPGWTSRLDSENVGGSSSYVFCPDAGCQKQAEWFDDQCPGCVSGYPDCGFGKAFAYERSPGLTAQQRAIVASGRCPFRINGTFRRSRGGFEDVNLSTPAPTEAGAAVLAGIDRLLAWMRDYRASEAARR